MPVGRSPVVVHLNASRDKTMIADAALQTIAERPGPMGLALVSDGPGLLVFLT